MLSNHVEVVSEGDPEKRVEDLASVETRIWQRLEGVMGWRGLGTLTGQHAGGTL